MSLPAEAPSHVTSVVADAGGQIVGRTRLQKLVYLLTAAGLENCFSFEYRHFGPFSEGLAEATQLAELLGDLVEEERRAQWGGTYSVFKTVSTTVGVDNKERHRLITIAAKADAVELELAATALFLAKEGHPSPWSETARRKPDKADGRLEEAKVLYRSIQAIKTPIGFPNIET